MSADTCVLYNSHCPSLTSTPFRSSQSELFPSTTSRLPELQLFSSLQLSLAIPPHLDPFSYLTLTVQQSLLLCLLLQQVCLPHVSHMQSTRAGQDNTMLRYIYKACGLGCSSVIECSSSMQEVPSPIPANTATVKINGNIQGVGSRERGKHTQLSGLTAGSVSVTHGCSPGV